MTERAGMLRGTVTTATDVSDEVAASLLEVAIRAAEAGAAELLQRSGRATGVQYKSTATDPVTDADRASEAAVVAVLTAERPDDAVFGEEGTATAGTTGLRWVVDPLDGTVNYLYGIPHSSVSVGCERAVGDDWEAVCGVVLHPAAGEVFSAVAGGGAWLNGTRLRVNDPVAMPQALVTTGFSYTAASRARQAAVVAELLPRIRDIRRIGSAALDLSWLAAGRCDAYYEDELNRWDWAAGALIAREAGALVSSLGGGLLACGPALHAELAAALSALSAPA